MWTMGYNDGGADFNMPDSFNGRKLRPLMPRPIPSANNPPCLSRINGTDLFALNHHLTVGDQNKREFNTQPVVVSSRWNPTPEQLRTLEELYRRGTRTPSAEQIQHITAQLRRYGKIEGKNVFYWFQNHKARERQKRRRQMESAPDEDIFERKDSTETAAKAAVAECRVADGWIQFDEGELQHTRNNVERNATWQQQQQQKMQFSNTNLINNSTTSAGAATPTIRKMDPKQQSLIKTHDHLNIFIAPNVLDHLINHNQEDHHHQDHDHGDSQTLQLFPLRSDNVKEKENGMISVAAAVTANFTTPYQFFEFLPLKN
ncbi:hypothetical protein COLO4_37684 [Corchorus olitorius]|uniref:Homeobox domain-containing protein n=1 Tax=Corchorus olitorius TaxID=93759 RepID=A0A1R3FZZ1_9ROSI|nr:hypothetical protein COLO4_37684 [Corchorus olitorius]